MQADAALDPAYIIQNNMQSQLRPLRSSEICTTPFQHQHHQPAVPSPPTLLPFPRPHSRASATRSLTSTGCLALLLWAAGHTPVRPPSWWLSSLLSELHRRAPSLSASAASTVLCSLAQLGLLPHPDLAAAFLARAHATLCAFSPQELSNTAWALGYMPPDCQPTHGSAFWGDFLTRVRELGGFSCFTPQGLANVLWGMAVAAGPPAQKKPPKAGAGALPKPLGGRGGERRRGGGGDRAAEASGPKRGVLLSLLGPNDLSSLRTALYERLHDMDERELSMTVWALARLRCTPGREWLDAALWRLVGWEGAQGVRERPRAEGGRAAPAARPDGTPRGGNGTVSMSAVGREDAEPLVAVRPSVRGRAEGGSSGGSSSGGGGSLLRRLPLEGLTALLHATTWVSPSYLPDPYVVSALEEEVVGRLAAIQSDRAKRGLLSRLAVLRARQAREERLAGHQGRLLRLRTEKGTRKQLLLGTRKGRQGADSVIRGGVVEGQGRGGGVEGRARDGGNRRAGGGVAEEKGKGEGRQVQAEGRGKEDAKGKPRGRGRARAKGRAKGEGEEDAQGKAKGTGRENAQGTAARRGMGNAQGKAKGSGTGNAQGNAKGSGRQGAKEQEQTKGGRQGPAAAAKKA